MTLPSSYSTSKDYLSDCLNFLKTFSWLYNYQNTHIVVKRVLKHFPCEWAFYFKDLSYNNLNKLLEGEVMEGCPRSLKELISKLIELKPKLTTYSQKCSPNLAHNSGLSRKKLHEIVTLAPMIDDVCKQNNANIIIDIGAGLGYLSHLMHDSYKYSVLGVEYSPQYIELAYKNQKKYYPNAKHHVKFAQHYIDQDSVNEISELSQTHFPNVSEKVVCIAGLHACADLSITILDLYTKLEFVNCLVLMPCCYHRIKLEKTVGEKEYFKNFPASKLFGDLFHEFEAESFVTRPFLRLACQQTLGIFKNMSTEEHEQHSRNCMYRAILQEVAEIENCRVKRLRRKSRKNPQPSSEEDFQAYLNNLKNTHQLEYEDEVGERLHIGDERFQRKMVEKWNEYKQDCFLVEVLTGLQAALQGICENVVLLDRVEFLKERGFECSVQKVTDDIISPRCYAVVASKMK